MSIIIINDKVNIPESEIHFRFDTSGGPGGQHANRSATRVTLLFDVAKSQSLDDKSRARLLEKLDHHLDKNGILHFSVSDTRSQKQNREIAISRFIISIADALVEEKERVVSKPSKHTIEKRIAEKKKHSQRKKGRRTDWSRDV